MFGTRCLLRQIKIFLYQKLYSCFTAAATTSRSAETRNQHQKPCHLTEKGGMCFYGKRVGHFRNERIVSVATEHSLSWSGDPPRLEGWHHQDKSTTKSLITFDGNFRWLLRFCLSWHSDIRIINAWMREFVTLGWLKTCCRTWLFMNVYDNGVVMVKRHQSW